MSPQMSVVVECPVDDIASPDGSRRGVAGFAEKELLVAMRLARVVGRGARCGMRGTHDGCARRLPAQQRPAEDRGFLLAAPRSRSGEVPAIVRIVSRGGTSRIEPSGICARGSADDPPSCRCHGSGKRYAPSAPESQPRRSRAGYLEELPRGVGPQTANTSAHCWRCTAIGSDPSVTVRDLLLPVVLTLKYVELVQLGDVD